MQISVPKFAHFLTSLQDPEALTRATLVTAGQSWATMREAGLDESAACALIVSYPQLLHAEPEQVKDMLRMFSRFSSGIDIKC